MNTVLKYNQAKLKIFELISSGKLHVGDRIPSERELVERFGLSLITVQRAMRELENENIIERRPRMGTYLMRPLDNVKTIGRMLYLRIYKHEYGETLMPDSMRNELEALLKEKNINIVYYNTEKPDIELAKLIQECMGVFVMGWLDREWCDFLKSLGGKIVVVGGNPFLHDLSNVSYDYRSAAEMLHLELLKSGCRRTGLINGGPTYYAAIEMHKGFMDAARKKSLKKAELPVVWSSQPRIAEDLGGYLEANPDLDGVLVETGELDALLACLWKMNYNRSLRIAIIVDAHSALRPFAPLKDGIAARFEGSLTELSISMMMDMLYEDKTGVRRKLVSPKLFYNS